MSTPVLLFGFEELRQKWGWLMALGISLIVLAIVALAIIPAPSLATAIVLGWLLVFSGTFEAIHGFQVRGSRSLFLHLIGGVLGVLVGLMVVTHPVAGALPWTLLFASFLTIVGVFRVVAAARLKFPHWGWAAFDGGITLLLGVMVWAGWPWSALWFLDLSVGVSLLLRGWSYVMFALALRQVSMPVEIRQAA
jgi:uncharacterized membrane protein HdeD (DUF308 family)